MKAHDELWACLSLNVVYINTSTSVYLYHESVPFRSLIHAMVYGSWVHVGACDGSQIVLLQDVLTTLPSRGHRALSARVCVPACIWKHVGLLVHMSQLMLTITGAQWS